MMVGRKAPAGKRAPAGRRATIGKRVTAGKKVVEQAVDVGPIVLLIQTRSGRKVVKTKPFEAGKN